MLECLSAWSQALRISQNNLWVILHPARRRSGIVGSRIGSRINPNYPPMSILDKSLSAENPSLLAGRNWLEKMAGSFIADILRNAREIVRLLSQSMEVKLPLANSGDRHRGLT